MNIVVAGYGAVNFFDIPENPRVTAISPHNRWALVAGDSGYRPLRLAAPDNIEPRLCSRLPTRQ